MFYAVTIGRKSGIYLQWAECKAVVDEYSGAAFKKYAKLHEATERMNGAGYSHSDILVHADMVSLPLSDYCHQHTMQVPLEVAPRNELRERDSQHTMDPKDVIIQRQTIRIEELESELRIVHRQLEQFQGVWMREFAERRRAALQYYRAEYDRSHHSRSSSPSGDGNDTID